MNDKKITVSSKMLELMRRVAGGSADSKPHAAIQEYRSELETLEAKERCFYNTVCRNPGFENSAEFVLLEACLPSVALRYKRMAVIVHTLPTFLRQFSISDKYTVDTHALSKVLQGYSDDLTIIKLRYGCGDRIQLPKIAGLMTNLIAKHKLVVPISIKDNPHSHVNEVFAIHHGLCICSDFSNGTELEEFSKTPEYQSFFDDMRFLLNRNYTPENLIAVFKTLCDHRFKSYLQGDTFG